MNAEELKTHLKSLNIFIQSNDTAIKKFDVKKYSNFYLTTSGVAFKSFSLIRESVVGKNRVLFFKLYAIKKRLLSPKTKLLGTDYLIIHNFWSNGYYHWLCEVLLKLVASEINYKEYTLLLPEEYKPFTTQSLEAFDFKDVLYLKKDHINFIKRGTIISNPFSSTFYKPNVEKLRNKYIRQDVKPFRKIYISRRKEKLRIVENEEIIYPMLLEYGYEIIEPQFLSFQQQVSLFSEAIEVISIHGAALTSIVFMNPGTKVIELYRELSAGDSMNLAYPCLAEAVGLNYYCYFFKLGKKDKAIDRSNILIDIEEFKKILEN